MTAAPGFWVRRGVVTATQVLPAGPIRERYRQELLAELYVLDRGHRAAFTLGALSHAWSLRAAVAGAQPRGEEVTMNRKPVLCLLNVHHRWRTVSTDDGERYSRCTRCGKDYTGTEGGGSGDWAAPVGM